MTRWNGKNPKPGTKRIDRNRLEKCFQDHGIDYRDFGIDFGYSKSWVQSAMCAGMASAPMLKALETIGIKYEDIAPIDMWNVVDEGGGGTSERGRDHERRAVSHHFQRCA